MEAMEQLGLNWMPDVDFEGGKEGEGVGVGKGPRPQHAAPGPTRPGRPLGSSRAPKGGGGSTLSAIGGWDEMDGGDRDALDFVAAVSGDQFDGDGREAARASSATSSPSGNVESSPGSLDRSGGSRGRSPSSRMERRGSSSRSPPSRPLHHATPSPRSSRNRSPRGRPDDERLSPFDGEAHEPFQRPQTAGPSRSARPHSPSSTRGLVPRPGSAILQHAPNRGTLVKAYGGPPPVTLGRHDVDVKALRVDESDELALQGAMGVSTLEGEFKRNLQLLSSISEIKAHGEAAAMSWHAAQAQSYEDGGSALQHALGMHASDFTPPAMYHHSPSTVLPPPHPAGQNPFPQRPGGTIRPASAMGRVESQHHHDPFQRPRSALRNTPHQSRTLAQQRPSTAHPQAHHPIARQSIRPPQRARPYTALAVRSLDQRLSAASQHIVEDDTNMMMIASVIPKQDPAKQRLTRPRSAYSPALRQEEEERRHMNVRALEAAAHGLERRVSAESSVSMGGVVEMDEVFATSRAGKVVRLLLGQKTQKGGAKQEQDWFRHKPRKVSEAHSAVLSLKHGVHSDVRATSMRIGSRPMTHIEAHRQGLTTGPSAAKPQAPRPKLSDTWRVRSVPQQHNTPSASLSHMGRASSSNGPEPPPEVRVDRQQRVTYVPGAAQQQQLGLGRVGVSRLPMDDIEQGVGVSGWDEPAEGSLYSPIRMLGSPDSRDADSRREGESLDSSPG